MRWEYPLTAIHCFAFLLCFLQCSSGNATVKELLKLVHICQSCFKNKSAHFYRQRGVKCVVMPSMMAARWPGRNANPIFLPICRLMNTQYSRTPVREKSQFATPFSVWRYLVAFRRYSRSSHFADFLKSFRAPIFREIRSQISDRILKIWATHHRLCSEIWWRSTSEIMGRKRKKKENKQQQQNIMATRLPSTPGWLNYGNS